MSKGLADTLLMGAAGVKALTGRGGIGKALQSPWITSAYFASPSTKLQERKTGTQRLLSSGKVSPSVARYSAMKKLSSIAPMEKRANFWKKLKRVFVRPELKPVWDQTGKVVGMETRQKLRAPWATAATVGGIGVGLMGLDFIQNQGRTVDRARSYRNMMKEYGPELLQIASDAQVPVPEEEIRNVYNALYTVAPDVAKNPTLAAAQMQPLIHQVSEPVDGKPNRIMHGLATFEDPSRLQRGVSNNKQVSDYAVQAGQVGRAASGLIKDMRSPSSIEDMDAEYLRAASREMGQARGRDLTADERLKLLEEEEDIRARARVEAQNLYGTGP